MQHDNFISQVADRVKHITVAAAIIIQDGKLFATERGYGAYKGWWEFPGGKLENGESAEEACVREIREELGATVEVQKLLDVVEYDYLEFHLTMHCFLCNVVDGEQLVLREHSAAKWLSRDELHSVKWLPADLGVVEKIARGM